MQNKSFHIFLYTDNNKKAAGWKAAAQGAV